MWWAVLGRNVWRRLNVIRVIVLESSSIRVIKFMEKIHMSKIYEGNCIIQGQFCVTFFFFDLVYCQRCKYRRSLAIYYCLKARVTGVVIWHRGTALVDCLLSLYHVLSWVHWTHLCGMARFHLLWRHHHPWPVSFTRVEPRRTSAAVMSSEPVETLKSFICEQWRLICGLFNDAGRCSDCVLLNERIVSEQRIGTFKEPFMAKLEVLLWLVSVFTKENHGARQ